jgi:hypothetical protein
VVGVVVVDVVVVASADTHHGYASHSFLQGFFVCPSSCIAITAVLI